MKNAWIFNSLMAAALLIGCDSDNDVPGGQAGGSSGQAPQTTDDPDDPPVTPDDDGEPDTLSGSSTGEPDDSDTEPDGEDTADCSFIGCDTDSSDTIEPACDLWAQDCPIGEKCMPWANDGGPAWNDARCTPLDSQPGQPGDACTVEGSGVSGIDSCDIGSMCWNVDEENNGVCQSLCQGTQNDPLCDNPAEACVPFNDGALPLCVPQCDPLLGCPDGEGCYPADGGFVCIPDASGPDLGGYGDACEYVNACDPGLLCANPAVVPGCVGSGGCCTNYCDLSEAEPAADCGGVSEGQECISAFAEGKVQPGLEDTGICAIPE